MGNLEVEALEVEKCTHQSFLQSCGAALQACPSDALGKLMYPIHLLTGNMSLTGPLMATSQLIIKLQDPFSSPCHPRRSATATCFPGAKWQHSPGCEVEPDWEAFHRDSDLVKCLRWTYFRTHPPEFHREVTYDLSDVFKEMMEMAGLIDLEFYMVQDLWWGTKELHTANYVARGSAKDLHYFWVVLPLKSPKIMGLTGIHSPEALKHQAGLSFCPWCGKKGQNEGTVVNHLHTGHYCLRLVCERCLSYFATTSDTKWHHIQGWEPTCFFKGKSDEEVEKFP